MIDENSDFIEEGGYVKKRLFQELKHEISVTRGGKASIIIPYHESIVDPVEFVTLLETPQNDAITRCGKCMPNYAWTKKALVISFAEKEAGPRTHSYTKTATVWFKDGKPKKVKDPKTGKLTRNKDKAHWKLEIKVTIENPSS